MKGNFSYLCCACRAVVCWCVVLFAAVLCAVCVCGVCPAVSGCAFPVLSALCGTVPRCAGAFALCCLCGPRCLWCLVLWCASVCCAVSCGVLWCGTGSGCPRLSFGGVFWCRCPCLAAWPASLWLVWFDVVPCAPVLCSVVLCCGVVLCWCVCTVLLVLFALVVVPGAVVRCFVLCCSLWRTVVRPLVACFGVGVPVWLPGLLRCGWCGLLWSPAPLCSVLWRFAVVWCPAVVRCCPCVVLYMFVLPFAVSRDVVAALWSPPARLCCVLSFAACVSATLKILKSKIKMFRSRKLYTTQLTHAGRQQDHWRVAGLRVTPKPYGRRFL